MDFFLLGYNIAALAGDSLVCFKALPVHGNTRGAMNSTGETSATFETHTEKLMKSPVNLGRFLQLFPARGL